MSDLFDNFYKIFKKDLLPKLAKYSNNPTNKITDNLNEFLNDPQGILTDIIEKFSINKNVEDYQSNYIDIENLNNIDTSVDDEYDELLKKLILIEENMSQIEKILNDKRIEKY
tara:strand:+ start:957 stop:1295 length:339 start_codon:yes stop_codon:yes gene_type:complete